MRNSISIFFLIVLSFLLGYVRDLLVAWRYGDDWMADALFIALLLPTFFENLLGVALKDSIIPYLQSLKLKGADVLQRQFQRLQIGVWAGAAGVTVLVMLGASIWIALLMPGWGVEKLNEFTFIFQLASILILIQSVLYFQAAVFNAGGHFVLPVTRSVLLNIGAIGALLYTASSVELVVVGMLLGQVILLGIMQIRLKALVTIRSASSDLGPSQKLSLTSYLMPLLIVVFSQQMCFVVERILCSYLFEGSIAHLSYAHRVAVIPMTPLIFSVLSLVYPALFTAWLDRRDGYFVQLLQHTISVTLVFLVPAAIMLAGASSDVLALLLQRGAFGPEQTVAIAPLLLIYGIGLPAIGITLFIGRVFVVIQKGYLFAKLTVASSLFIMCVDVVVYSTYGTFGLAVSYTVGNWLQALILLVLIMRYVPAFRPWVSLLRWLSACPLICWGVLLLKPISGWVELLLTCVAVFSSCVILVAALGERQLVSARFWRAVLNHRVLENAG